MLLIEKLPSILTESKNGKLRNRPQGKFFCPICKSYVIKDLHNGKKTISCGSKECTPSRSFRHGYAGTEVYESWRAMKARCTNPKLNTYKYYGAKGITYPEKWETFEGFLEDMGDPLDPKLTIDRIDNTKSYCKENCQWITFSENASKDKNKEVIQLDEQGNEIGRYKSAKEAAEATGIHYPSLARVARGERKSCQGTYWQYI